MHNKKNEVDISLLTLAPGLEISVNEIAVESVRPTSGGKVRIRDGESVQSVQDPWPPSPDLCVVVVDGTGFKRFIDHSHLSVQLIVCLVFLGVLLRTQKYLFVVRHARF